VFERFTDRARRVAELAQGTARELNHDVVGTDHLLIALAAEGDGVAARALKSLGVGEAEVREAALKRHPAGTVKQAGHIFWGPHGKKALELALREALQFGHTYIGTEHLLLGLIRLGDDSGPLALADCGIAEHDLGFLSDVREAVLTLLRGYANQSAAAAELRSAVARARHRLITAALQSAARDYLGGSDEAVRDDDRLFVAARGLVEAVGNLPASEQPSGWSA
jgi:ATP-dependent Clp protease ATP-binding subunit ClpC